MPSFLQIEDPPEQAASTDRPPRSLGEVRDANTYEMVFDKEAVADLKALTQHLRGDPTFDDIIYSALELLGLALKYEVTIESKYHRGEKSVVNLWATE